MNSHPLANNLGNDSCVHLSRHGATQTLLELWVPKVWLHLGLVAIAPLLISLAASVDASSFFAAPLSCASRDSCDSSLI